MIRQHHQLNGHKFEHIPGDSGEEESDVPQSMVSQRVRHDSVTEKY